MINLPKSYVGGLRTRNPLICSLRPYRLGQQAGSLIVQLSGIQTSFKILGATTVELGGDLW